jgi:anion-transporting  ArsA/GET3 family ATPase
MDVDDKKKEVKDTENHMNLNELLNKRLIIVSGKGGVGKTSLSTLLALLAADLNKKVLIVEMNSTGRIAPIFKANQVMQKEIQLTPLVSAINLSPELCFKDYAISLLYFSALYKSFFTNRYVSNFIKAVPGLDEFMMLTKINDLENQSKGKLSSRMKYDLIVIDAPATGHGLSLLEVPAIIASAIKIGPPHKQALSIMEMLSDKLRTAFCLVTLAEEMPVCESEEYVSAIKERTNLGFGPMFVNAVMPGIETIDKTEKLPKKLKLFKDYYELAQKRFELNQYYLDEINKRFPDLSKITIPFQLQGLRTYQDFILLLESMKKELR